MITEIITRNTQLEDAIKIGIIKWSEKKPDEALAYFDEVRPLFLTADPLLKAKFHNNLGLVYKQKAESNPEYLDKAIEEYELVKLYLEQTNDPLAVAIIENNLANIELLAGRPENAHRYLDKAEEIFKGKDETFYAQAREIRARAFYAQKRYKDASKAITESKRILLYGVELEPLIETVKTERRINMALEAQLCLECGNNSLAAQRFGITPHGVRKKLKEYDLF